MLPKQHYLLRAKTSSGFLVCEGHGPAFDPRDLLLRAGDVERNPGPESCHACTSRLQRKHFDCAVDGCGVKSHMRRKCSGVGKGQTEWRCPEHRRNEQGEKCDQCGRTFTGSSSPRTCCVDGCKRMCHRGQKCSKIGKYGKSRVLDWTCREHRGESSPTSPLPTSAAKKTKRKCKGCRETIR